MTHYFISLIDTKTYLTGTSVAQCHRVIMELTTKQKECLIKPWSDDVKNMKTKYHYVQVAIKPTPGSLGKDR